MAYSNALELEVLCLSSPIRYKSLNWEITTKCVYTQLLSFAGASEKGTTFLHKIIPCIHHNSLLPERFEQLRCHDSRVVLISIPKCHVVSIFGGRIHKMKLCTEVEIHIEKGVRD